MGRVARPDPAGRNRLSFGQPGLSLPILRRSTIAVMPEELTPIVPGIGVGTVEDAITIKNADATAHSPTP